ncbi:MAG: hypothetical protein ACTSRP_07315 [Candidatus Helarchaeota archaeon]
MSIGKIKNKKLLEELQAKLALKLGKRFTIQEIIDKSIEYLSVNLDKFIEDYYKFIELPKKRLDKIINRATDIEYYTSGDENKDIYG